MKTHRFTKPQILKQIGRRLLTEFLDRFAEELEACEARIPDPGVPDEIYYRELSRWLMAAELLPDRLIEALRAIDELATPRGQEDLELALERAGSNLKVTSELTPAEMVLQVWLAAPELVARQYNQRRMLRLSTFESFAGVSGRALVRPVAEPDSNALKALTAALDPWFERHNRGMQTTRIEVYTIDGEYWFLVRHGDTFTRRAKVEQQKTELLHFRPERDDVIVFSPEQGEIRVSARTRGEKELYRRTFGLVLFGDGEHFLAMQTYTLEPLRTDGAAALDTEGLDGITKITLRVIQVALGNAFHNVVTSEAVDIFASAAHAEGAPHPIPEDGQLTCAAFELRFTDSMKIASVQVRPPNILKLSRHCDSRKVGEWLLKRGFRAKVL